MTSAEISTTQRAENLLHALFNAAGDGCHVMSASTGACTAVVPFHNAGNRTYLGQGVDMAEAVATTSRALAGGGCGVVLRTIGDEGNSRAWGWRLRGAVAIPLTAGELRRAYTTYSTDWQISEPLPLEPGLHYDDAPHLHLS